MMHEVVHTFRDLRQHKVRSLITLSGAMWGVMILVGIYTPVRAFERESALIFERAGGVRQFTVDLDRRTEARLPALSALLPPGYRLLPASENLQWLRDPLLDAPDRGWRHSAIWGVPPAFTGYFGFTVAAGRGLTPVDDALENRVCVIGAGVRRGGRRGAQLLGESLPFCGARYVVVGALEAVVHEEWEMVRYDLMGLAGGFPDDCVFLPLTAARTVLDAPLRLHVRAPDDADMADSMKRLAALLPGRTPNAASVIDTARYFERFMAKWKRGLWVVIAICLLMSGLGLAVLMLSSVHLRIREIGIRKAVGASNLDIAVQFLIETSVLSTLGGIAGVGAGLSVARIGCDLIGFPFHVDTGVVWAGFGAATALGILFGVVPAIAAARMSPVEALRAE